MKNWIATFIFHSMTPYIVGEVSTTIKKLIRSLAEYEFELNNILNEEKLSMEEEKAKFISLKGIIWRELGKDAYKEWHEYFNSKVDTPNTLMLAILMYEKLLDGTYACIKEAEHNQEKRKPRQTKILLSQKREVIIVV